MTWGEATSSKPYVVRDICSVGLHSFNACAKEKRPSAHSLESLATDGTGWDFYFSKLFDIQSRDHPFWSRPQLYLSYHAEEALFQIARG
jgi:hypothetical protein